MSSDEAKIFGVNTTWYNWGDGIGQALKPHVDKVKPTCNDLPRSVDDFLTALTRIIDPTRLKNLIDLHLAPRQYTTEPSGLDDSAYAQYLDAVSSSVAGAKKPINQKHIAVLTDLLYQAPIEKIEACILVPQSRDTITLQFNDNNYWELRIVRTPDGNFTLDLKRILECGRAKSVLPHIGIHQGRSVLIKKSSKLHPRIKEVLLAIESKAKEAGSQFDFDKLQ